MELDTLSRLSLKERTALRNAGGCFYCRKVTNPPHTKDSCPEKLDAEQRRANAGRGGFSQHNPPFGGIRGRPDLSNRGGFDSFRPDTHNNSFPQTTYISIVNRGRGGFPVAAQFPRQGFGYNNKTPMQTTSFASVALRTMAPTPGFVEEVPESVTSTDSMPDTVHSGNV